ncbi:sensor histidine kinase [Variovorax sp. RHLX14]|uniref:sensor histidine kinase n=1 Tax=Variovorax sp. RHLX14 TaxID=1259731 RepID=UPI003F46CDD7
MRRFRRSMGRELLGPLLSLWVASAIVATLCAFWLVGRASDLSFDRFLQDDALALSTQLQWNGGIARFAVDQATAASLVFDSLSHSRFAVRTVSGRTLVSSAAIEPPTELEWEEPGRPVFFDVDNAKSGTPLRAVIQRFQPTPGDEAVVIVVAESRTGRNQVSREIALAIFLPAALVGFVIVPLIYLGVRHGLAPTWEISDAVSHRGFDDLSPMPVDSVPDELRGMVTHTNALLLRLQTSMLEQRRFLSDAAHQLQTPIAGIRLLVGDMRRTQRADARQPADADVLSELDRVAARAVHLVRQLMAFARIDQEAVVESIDFDPADVLDALHDQWLPAIEKAGKTLSMRRHQPAEGAACLLNGSPTLLHEVVGNLLDNALRYGGDSLALTSELLNDEIVIAVEDNGPELDATTRENMLRPFWRGTHGLPGGSGLGLSIAHRVIERLGGVLAVRTRPGVVGTRVEVRLPRKTTGSSTGLSTGSTKPFS